MKHRSLHYSAHRLAALYVALCALCVGGLLWIGFLFSAHALDREVDLVIATELDGLRDDYDAGGLQRLVAALNRRTDSWGRTGAVYLLVDAANKAIAGNLSTWPITRPMRGGWIEFDLTRAGNAAAEHPVRAEVYDLGHYRLLVGTDVSEHRRIAAQLRDTAAWGVVLAALLSAAIGWGYSRRVAAQVRIVAQTCESVISGTPMPRLPQRGSKDEFDQLAAAVNHMLDRIEQQTLALRATFNSAAHDLRAPLHRMRVRLESLCVRADLGAATRAAVDDTVEDLVRVQRTLATLLQIAQADASATPGSQEDVDLSQLGQELGELYEPEARERGLALTVRTAPAASVTGNRQLLAQLLANLLENAIKYVPAGGQIGLRVEADGSSASLIVSDNGPGLPAKVCPGVQPLQGRHEGTQGEGGLGLSLVAAVVRLHRGQLALLDNRPGLAVRCDFPLTPPAAAA